MLTKKLSAHCILTSFTGRRFYILKIGNNVNEWRWKYLVRLSRRNSCFKWVHFIASVFLYKLRTGIFSNLFVYVASFIERKKKCDDKIRGMLEIYGHISLYTSWVYLLHANSQNKYFSETVFNYMHVYLSE